MWPQNSYFQEPLNVIFCENKIFAYVVKMKSYCPNPTRLVSLKEKEDLGTNTQGECHVTREKDISGASANLGMSKIARPQKLKGGREQSSPGTCRERLWSCQYLVSHF